MTVTMEVLSARNLHMFHRSSAVSTSRFDGFSHVCPPCINEVILIHTTRTISTVAYARGQIYVSQETDNTHNITKISIV